MPPHLAVALLHFTAPPVVGGVEQVVGQHARLAADAGHAVRIVAGRGRQLDARVTFVEVPLADTAHPEIVRLQAELGEGRVPEAFAGVAAALADELMAALAGVDVLVAHNVASLGLNLALTWALRDVVARAGAPRTVLWHHDLAWAIPAHRRELHDGDPWDLLRTHWPGVVQVAVSEARRADLATLQGVDPAGVAVVPNGVDLARLLGLAPRTVRLVHALGLADRAPLVLQPARITPRKNIEAALRIVAAMRTSGAAGIGLVVTGPVDPHDAAAQAYLAMLVALRRELGLEERVIFLAEELEDPADDALVHELYRLADVLLLPSHDEGFGIPILEAGANRLPIVCSDLPALRELAGEAAVYVDPAADPAAVAALVLGRLDADPRARLARRVRTELTWEAVYRWGIGPLLVGAPTVAARR